MPQLTQLAWIGLLVFLVSCQSSAQSGFTFRQARETSGATSWIFEDKSKPPLHLDDQAMFVRSVNDALANIGLPKVERAVPELQSITKSRLDRATFKWDDYARGVLTVQRTLCQDSWLKKYDCIWKVTLTTQQTRPH